MIHETPHENNQPTSSTPNPCLSCGACCAHFRVSFYWAEGEDATEGGVPCHLTEQLTNFLSVMKGTNSMKPYCVSLKGEIGSDVRCGIYEKRPSSCRDFDPTEENGETSERCLKARTAWGLKTEGRGED